MWETVTFTLSNVFATVAAAIPDREFVVWGERRVTYAESDRRSTGFARFLAGRGIGCRTERSALAAHASGQDHVGIYLRNCTEYPEVLIGSYRARAVPFNINYRYVDEELRYLLTDAQVRVLVYQDEFAPRVAAVLPALTDAVLLVQVADGSGNPLLPGAIRYEDVVATTAPDLPETRCEDLYLLYTGGTTGMPKGVLWRQEDIYLAAMGGTRFGTGEEIGSYAALAASAAGTGGAYRLVVAAPFMHGAAQWLLFQAVTNGGTLVLPTVVDRFDAAAVLDAVARERVIALPLVGDAMARPVAAELERRPYDLEFLAAVHNAGAPLSPAVRQRLVAAFGKPVLVVDSVGSSEAGIQMTQVFDAADGTPGAYLPAGGDTAVLDDALSRTLDEPGAQGWLGRKGRIPLGYLGDADKTARTFPVVDGVRWSIAGDRATVLADGRVALLGRDNLTVNSGGEKIFVEEVERAVAAHPEVLDVVVVGRPSEQWGSEVVAIVHVRDAAVTDADLLAECAAHIARYKLPKAIIRCSEIRRSPAGKADYRWARDLAVEG
ncbi:putative fatty-acid--CoA ligase [Nocardia asteroides NBRC 15531]|uniref:Fatty-acid--CoA ligase n=1 Tax=Nocardia asteroides NBRC 15531 TaxID=1110697 RepID=U5EI39_NOCAS|nr:putative fatty-acid--CoA ligase [Nocardia asteroides NBRC 15531]SFM30092.1 fatty-acyl-CoA synthase [Nocardia asteroides]VEG35818.1 Long-chain-fatty-acid--CoA ligase FadD19 [Nocardia asteroides]